VRGIIKNTPGSILENHFYLSPKSISKTKMRIRIGMLISAIFVLE